MLLNAQLKSNNELYIVYICIGALELLKFRLLCCILMQDAGQWTLTISSEQNAFPLILFITFQPVSHCSVVNELIQSGHTSRQPISKRNIFWSLCNAEI